MFIVDTNVVIDVLMLMTHYANNVTCGPNCLHFDVYHPVMKSLLSVMTKDILS